MGAGQGGHLPGGRFLHAAGEGGAEGRGGASALQAGPLVRGPSGPPPRPRSRSVGSSAAGRARSRRRSAAPPASRSSRRTGSASRLAGVRPTERAPAERVFGGVLRADLRRGLPPGHRRAGAPGRGVILDATFRERASTGCAPGTWRGATDGASSSSSDLPTRPRCGRGSEPGPRAPRSRTPGSRCSSGSGGVRARHRARPGRARPRQHDGAAGRGGPGRAGLPLEQVGVVLDRRWRRWRPADRNEGLRRLLR